jgi:hypothetical protein
MKKTVLPLLLLCTLLVTSCGKLNIPGVSGPNFSTTDTHAVIDLTIENFDLDGELSADVPKFGDSFVSVAGIDEGGTNVGFNFDIETLTNGAVETLEPQTLPGGRALPIIGGVLPGVAFNVPGFKNLHVYLGSKVYGFFLPIVFPSEVQGILTYEVKVKGKKYGVAAVVGNDDNGENSGILILVDLNTLSKKSLRRLRKLQNKFGPLKM